MAKLVLDIADWRLGAAVLNLRFTELQDDEFSEFEEFNDGRIGFLDIDGRRWVGRVGYVAYLDDEV